MLAGQNNNRFRAGPSGSLIRVLQFIVLKVHFSRLLTSLLPHLHLINIHVISFNIRHKEATLLGDDLRQVKALAVLGEATEDQGKLTLGPGRHSHPIRGQGDVFRMDQFAAVGHIAGDQVGGWPDPDVHAIGIGAGIVTVNDHLLFLLGLFLELLPGGRADARAGSRVGGQGHGCKIRRGVRR